MIVDFERFLREERPFWDELDAKLHRLQEDHTATLDLEQIRRFHYLYERAATDLAKLSSFPSEPELQRFLESLVARAYSEIHAARGQTYRFHPVIWFWQTFPGTFRKHLGAFGLALVVTLAGAIFGGTAILVDADAKGVLLGYPHLQVDPRERVAQEEMTESMEDVVQGVDTHVLGTVFYIQNNTKVAFTTMALGVSWGIGTFLVLLGNGVLLGAVVLDYIQAGETIFLIGWLLPHGATEIPAILLAGQAGFVIGGALIGWRSRVTLRQRLRAIRNDAITLIAGVTLLLIWAGFVEAFFSQYHEPIIPYAVKIAFGTVELVALFMYLFLAGRRGGADV
ncbi:MAG: hypothetical protein AMXMBFR84_48740 [Candidatus Hydrogenedentota bacterium]